DGIRYWSVTGVQTCALPIFNRAANRRARIAIGIDVLGPVGFIERRLNAAASRGLVGVRGLQRSNGKLAHRRQRVADAARCDGAKIGRASCRERVESAGVRG